MRSDRAGDGLCVVLAILAVVDVVQLDLEPRPVVLLAQLSLWALLLARHLSLACVLLVPVVPVLLGVVAPGTNQETVTQAAALYLAGYWLGRRGSTATHLLAVPLVLGSHLAIEVQDWPLDRTDVSDTVYVNAPVLLALLVGARLTRREQEREELRMLQHRLDAELAARAEQVLAEERQRIGRELHDVVAQGAGAVVAQATAARMLVTAGRTEQAADALVAVEDTSREGLADMRRLLGVLRDPAPDGPLQEAAR